MVTLFKLLKSNPGFCCDFLTLRLRRLDATPCCRTMTLVGTELSELLILGQTVKELNVSYHKGDIHLNNMEICTT